MRRIAYAALAAGFLAGPAHAASQTYQLDPTHTFVLFAVNHLGFSTAHGVFREAAGTLTLDQDKPEASKLDVTIKAESIDTWMAERDKHLKSDEFFDVAKYPELHYVSRKITRTGDKTARIEGDLTMHGITKPVILNVTLNQVGTNPMDKKQHAGFSASGSLKRSDFGMAAFLPMLGDETAITIDTEFIQQP